MGIIFMSAPFQIIIRSKEPTNYLVRHIKEKASKFNQLSPNILKCRIVVDSPQRNQLHGNLHAVHIELKIPKDEIVINKIEDKNIYVAIHNAVNAACRQLLDLRKRKQLRRRH